MFGVAKMRRRISSQHRFYESRQRETRRQQVRRLTFDSLEDRRLFAGLNIFVYDDANSSGTWESPSESPLAEQVVYVDSDNDAHLGANESYGITGADGKVLLDNLSVSIARIRLLGSTASPTMVALPSSNSIVDVQLASKRGIGNSVPVLSALPSQSIDEDTELALSRSFFESFASDANNDLLTFFIVGQPSNGSINWSVETGGTYKPNANFNGSDTVVFRAFDGKSWSSAVSLDITINSVDDLPTAIEFESGSIPENQLGYVIGPITLVDIDGGSNSIHLTPESLFEIQNGKVKLIDGIGMNYEQASNANIEISVFVGSNQIPVLTKTFSLPVLNRNDPPTALVFEGQTHVEEFIAGFEFGKIKIEDEDVGDQYDFLVSDNRFAVVDGKLGLKSDTSLTYADASSISVTVTAVSQSSNDQISETFDIEVVRAAPPWQNKHWGLDVNNDGELTPVDVLIVINALNRLGVVPLDRQPPPGSSNFIDVNGDRYLTPLDALILINALNRQSRGGAEGLPNGGNGSGGSGSGADQGSAGEGEAPSSQSPKQLAMENNRSESPVVSNNRVSNNSNSIAVPIDEDSGVSSSTRKTTRRVR